MVAKSTSPTALQLPIQVVGPTDVSRLLREIESIEDFLHQGAIRESGGSVKLPLTSRLLDEFTKSNNLNFLQPTDRHNATTFLKLIKNQAPTIHISFAADPSVAFISKIITWLRANIHQQLLLQIGLQPSIAAGCVVRTANHSFDFSLRRRFDDQRSLLISKLQEGRV